MLVICSGVDDMNRSLRFGVALVIGIVLVAVSIIVYALMLQTSTWQLLSLALGIVASGVGAYGLRQQLRSLARGTRLEIAAFALGAVGVVICLGYFSARFTTRLDLTEAGIHSLAPETKQLLSQLSEPVHIVFFHNRLMAETRELYQLMASQTDKLSVEFHDPALNPAKARLAGVQFAGTAVITSAGRTQKINASSEEDIANALLRITQGAIQRVCFLEGHNEADPFSMESHDHTESSAGVDHSHGLGEDFVLHDRHGIAKARHALETFNYEVRSLALTQQGHSLDECTVLVVAGPKSALLANEVTAIRSYLRHGGNALMMLDPFIETGLEAVLIEYGIALDNTMVIDGASHYWTDVSAPAVTRYNNHQITRELALTFYPGARSLSPTPVRIPGTTVSPVVNSSTTSYAESSRQEARFDAEHDRRGPLTLMAISNRRTLRANDASDIDLGPNAARDRARLEALVGDAPSQVTARSRLAVIGDSDFATNSFFHFLGNGKLFLNTVNYLAAQENLIGVEPRRRELPKLSVTNRQIKGTFIASMALVPSLLALIGTLVWWRQR